MREWRKILSECFRGPCSLLLEPVARAPSSAFFRGPCFFFPSHSVHVHRARRVFAFVQEIFGFRGIARGQKRARIRAMRADIVSRPHTRACFLWNAHHPASEE